MEDSLSLKTMVEQAKSFLMTDTINLSEQNFQEFYNNLHKVITTANLAYYVYSDPIMNDVDFDILYEALLRLKNNNEKYWIIIIAEEKEYLGEQSWDKQHYAPMLSLQKIKDEKWLNDFFSSNIFKVDWINGLDTLFSIEPKFDWLSIELVYKNWKLIDAITRGDGQSWISVIQTVQYIPSVPKQIDKPQFSNYNWEGILSIRWEIILPISKFKELSNTSDSNPRNLASWLVRTLEPDKTKCEKLSCYAYDILHAETIDETLIKSQALINSLLKEMWFLVFPFFSTRTWKELANLLLLEEQKQWLKNQDIELDWYVIKLNDRKKAKELWNTGHHPRADFAYKYQGEQASTILKDVTWQVWKSGILTPVAELEPVNIWWVMVKRATLHNFDFIKTKWLHIWDSIEIQRSWDVIPYVLWLSEDNKNKNKEEIIPPTHCPICWNETSIEVSNQTKNNNINNLKVYCRSSECSAQMSWKVLQVVWNHWLDIIWFWNVLVESIVENSWISSPCEIVLLEKYKHNLFNLEWMGHKKIENLEIALENAKTKKFSIINLLVTLNIPITSKGIARLLVEAMQESIKNWKSIASIDELVEWLKDENNYINTKWIGWIVAHHIQTTMYLERCKKDIEALKKFWLQIKWEELQPKQTNIEKENINNTIHFSITGSFSESRPKIVKDLEENYWFIYHESPTKECSVVFVGEKAWSKASKAEKLNIPIYYWDEWIKHFLDEIKKNLN